MLCVVGTLAIHYPIPTVSPADHAAVLCQYAGAHGKTGHSGNGPGQAGDQGKVGSEAGEQRNGTLQGSAR